MSRLEAGDEYIYILTFREASDLKLTIYARSRTWSVTLTTTELRSMASKVGIDIDDFTDETYRAFTNKPNKNEYFVYNLNNDDDGLVLVWKRHLLKENIKVSKYLSIITDVI